MSEFNASILAQNVRNHIEASGLSREDVANLSEVSPGTLKNIEKGKVRSRDKNLDGVLNLLCLDYKIATRRLIKVPLFYRDRLRKAHAKKENFKTLLDKDPSIGFALEYYLIPSGELKDPKKIGDIRDYFLKLEWDWQTTLISGAIGKNKNRLNIKTKSIEGSKKGYEYYI